MTKFCASCGKEMNEANGFCASCGVATNQVSQSKGKGIASLILGIIGLTYSLIMLLGLSGQDLREIEGVSELTTTGEFFFVAAFVVALPIIFSIIGFFLANSERKVAKNGINGAGFWISLITLALSLIVFTLVFNGIR